MAYATAAELSAYTGIAEADLPADVARQLERASEAVDAALVASIYDVDANGDPTDAGHIAAVRDATCAVVEAWIVTGDEHDLGSRYSSVSIGSLNLTQAANRQAAPARLPQRAWDHLQLAGLLPGSPEA